MKMTIEPGTPAATNREPMVMTKLSDFEAELDGYFEVMQTFKTMSTSEVLETLSAFTARAGQIRQHLIRQDNRQFQAFRTKQLDPFIEECRQQFKIWSRHFSVKEFEWETSRGQR